MILKKGGGGVRRLMANAIKNFHFVLKTSIAPLQRNIPKTQSWKKLRLARFHRLRFGYGRILKSPPFSYRRKLQKRWSWSIAQRLFSVLWQTKSALEWLFSQHQCMPHKLRGISAVVHNQTDKIPMQRKKGDKQWHQGRFLKAREYFAEIVTERRCIYTSSELHNLWQHIQNACFTK